MYRIVENMVIVDNTFKHVYCIVLITNYVTRMEKVNSINRFNSSHLKFLENLEEMFPWYC